MTSGQRLNATAGQGMNLFARGEGLKAVAGEGPLLLQAQADTLTANAQKDIKLTSNEGQFVAMAKTIRLVAEDGSYIEIGNGVTIGTNGSIKLLSASHQWGGPSTQQVSQTPFNRAPTDQQFRLHVPGHTDETPAIAANRSYRISLDDGRVIEGKSDANGLTNLLKDDMARIAKIDILKPTLRGSIAFESRKLQARRNSGGPSRRRYFLHGVNDPGGNYDHIEKGLCEGLNERLSRVDLKPGEYGVAFQKALKYTHKDPDFAQWRETKYDPDTYLYKRTEITDGPGKTHSMFIPFYWGYRASPDEIKGGEKNPVTLRGQYQDKHGNRLSKHFAKGGGMFNNATTNIPAMFDPGWLDNTANQVASAKMSDYQYSTESPHRHYFVLAAKRLAMLIHEIRRVDPNETISIMAHSQGTMITLLSQAFLVEDSKERCADCVIMVDTPYGVSEPVLGDIAQPSATPYTSRGKINTLKNIVKAVTGNPWPSPKLDELKVEQQPGTPNPKYQGRTGHGWSPAQASRRDKDGSIHTFQERDNRGKVYLYFCTEDTTVDLPNIKGIGTHGVPDTVEEGWFSDKKNSIWKPIQKSKAVLPAMNELKNLRFYQRLWTKKVSGINNGQPVLVGTTPAHYDGTYDAGLISKDIEKRWINGEAIVPPYKPNLYGDEGIKGDPNTSGRDKPDYVSRDTLLGNPGAKDIRVVAMPDVPKDVFDGGYQKGRSQKSSATISKTIDFKLLGHCLVRRIPAKGLTRSAVE
ncbi:hypothetical protein NLI96_g13103 [Meripilus lineatus]|uniref:DUF3274 domain-containing protein n=1 Tax=Meripilus lineatus TaxID=2056292 RepID=A0AAD5UNY3_9APHY|nr:hypothetical protein NLI96_g13103 [Physisporinus lineatus]